MDIAAMKAEFRASLPEILEGRDPMLAVAEGHVRCEQCRMTFQIGSRPTFGMSDVSAGDVTICSEPGCKRRFWHSGTSDPRTGGHMALVGIFPDSKRARTE